MHSVRLEFGRPVKVQMGDSYARLGKLLVDTGLIDAVSKAVGIPVIASSGAGNPKHFVEVFEKTGAAAALAAGIFHRREVPISDVKQTMADAGIPTRLQ